MSRVPKRIRYGWNMLIKCTNESEGSENPYRTGRLWCISKDAGKRLGIKVDIAYIAEELADKLNLSRE